MGSQENIVDCLNEVFSDYRKSVTELSRTDEGNNYIIDDIQMFDWDSIAKSSIGNNSSSVDAIHCSFKENELELYFFEFKKLNLYDIFFDAKKELTLYLDQIDNDDFYEHVKYIRKLKKKLISKKLVSLKTKPVESLFLLHQILNNEGIDHEDLIKVKKKYYIVSKTVINKNRNNIHLKGRSAEIFGFINKIKPFPFIEVEPINEKTFFTIIHN